MRQTKDYRASIILAATLVSGALGAACVARVGFYDPDHRDYHHRDYHHRDYHHWDDREDRAYRHFLAERRQEYRGFSSLSVDDQNEYWRWRHVHPDEG